MAWMGKLFDHQRHPDVSRQRLRNMMKHLAKKKYVKIIWDIESSVPDYSWKRVYKGKIIEWRVTAEYIDSGAVLEYGIWAKFKDGTVMDEAVPADAFFDGLCRVRWINSGPDCFFYGEW